MWIHAPREGECAEKTTLDRLNLRHDIEDAVANKPSVKGRNSRRIPTLQVRIQLPVRLIDQKVGGEEP
jgi:hypothetical protein